MGGFDEVEDGLGVGEDLRGVRSTTAAALTRAEKVERRPIRDKSLKPAMLGRAN